MALDDKYEDQFTLYKDDLQITHKVEGENPYGYSYKDVDGETVYFDDDNNPVNPAIRPITDADLAAATAAFKMETRDASYLTGLIERCLGHDSLAGMVVVKAAGRALEKITQG